MSQYDTLVMCSGGIDSVVALYKLVDEGKSCRIFYADHDKRVTNSEIAVVKRLSVALKMPLDIVNVKGLADLQRAYDDPIRILEEELDIDIGKGSRSGGGTRQDQKFITGFHCILSAASFAAHLTDGASIACGVNKDQVAGYPSIRSAFDAWKQTVAMFNPGVSLDVVLPVIDLTKAEIIALGHRLGVPFVNTWSCVASRSFVHCGTCHQCVSRQKGFKDAGGADPTVYEMTQ